MRLRCIFLTATLLLCSAATTQADFITNDFGLTSPEQTIAFDELGLRIDTPVTNQYLGVTFTDGVFQSPQSLDGLNIFNFDDQWVGNFVDGQTFTNPFSLFFDTELTDAAFAFISNTGTTEFTALLDGNVVETFAALTQVTDPNNFFGFENIVFDEIRITVDPVTQAAGIDNLQFTTVPEPGSSIFCGLLASVCWRRRR